LALPTFHCHQVRESNEAEASAEGTDSGGVETVRAHDFMLLMEETPGMYKTL